jgi:hypothetical protein
MTAMLTFAATTEVVHLSRVATEALVGLARRAHAVGREVSPELAQVHLADSAAAETRGAFPHEEDLVSVGQ